MSEFNILVYLIRILEVVIVELDMFKMGTNFDIILSLER